MTTSVLAKSFSRGSMTSVSAKLGTRRRATLALTMTTVPPELILAHLMPLAKTPSEDTTVTVKTDLKETEPPVTTSTSAAVTTAAVTNTLHAPTPLEVNNVTVTLASVVMAPSVQTWTNVNLEQATVTLPVSHVPTSLAGTNVTVKQDSKKHRRLYRDLW